jgi:hypothetical protein
VWEVRSDTLSVAQTKLAGESSGGLGWFRRGIRRCSRILDAADRFRSQGGGLRRFFSLELAASLFLFALLTGFAQAQQVDFAVSGDTLWSSANKTAAAGFLPPAERGGVYPGINLQYRWSDRLGISAEGLFRYDRGLYDGYQQFRPVFYDVNGVYTSKVARKITLDLLGGVGGESLIFYNQYGYCGSSTGCSAHLNSNHFLLHAGFGLRYYIFRNIYIRPEAHYNFIPNNFEFHSDNVFRIGASVGYTFGRKAETPAPAPPAQPAQPVQPAQPPQKQ